MFFLPKLEEPILLEQDSQAEEKQEQAEGGGKNDTQTESRNENDASGVPSESSAINGTAQSNQTYVHVPAENSLNKKRPLSEI